VQLEGIVDEGKVKSVVREIVDVVWAAFGRKKDQPDGLNGVLTDLFTLFVQGMKNGIEKAIEKALEHAPRHQTAASRPQVASAEPQPQVASAESQPQIVSTLSQLGNESNDNALPHQLSTRSGHRLHNFLVRTPVFAKSWLDVHTQVAATHRERTHSTQELSLELQHSQLQQLNELLSPDVIQKVVEDGIHKWNLVAAVDQQRSATFDEFLVVFREKVSDAGKGGLQSLILLSDSEIQGKVLYNL
jgi:hypothetical protein